MAKKKNRNLAFQFKNAIDNAFGKDGKGGVSKHAMRKAGEDTTTTVFSYKERSSLLKTSKQLADFLKDNYPDIKEVSQINSNMVQEFLNHKANTNNLNSLTTIKSTLTKLDKVSTKRYETKSASFMEDVKAPKTTCENNIRKNVNCTKLDWQKIEEQMQKSRSKANDLIRIAKTYGLRVESLSNLRAKDFDFENRKIYIIDDKGRRDRILEMTDVDICKNVVGVRSGDDRVTTMRPGSINKQFTRLAEKAGIEKFKEAKTGIHALRKQSACDLAIKLKMDGLEREEILSKVSVWLGHGTSRRDVLKKYLDSQTIDFISKV